MFEHERRTWNLEECDHGLLATIDSGRHRCRLDYLADLGLASRGGRDLNEPKLRVEFDPCFKKGIG
jgi:hypothetical protein